MYLMLKESHTTYQSLFSLKIFITFTKTLGIIKDHCVRTSGDGPMPDNNAGLDSQLPIFSRWLSSSQR